MRVSAPSSPVVMPPSNPEPVVESRRIVALDADANVLSVQRAASRQTRTPTDKLVDLRDVLSPEDFAKLDPRVVAFYENPTRFDLRAGVDMSLLGYHVLPMVAVAIHQGQIEDSFPGFEDLPMRQELTVDEKGHTHWHRMVEQGGKWHTLFDATFERDGKYIKETFKRGPLRIPLVFKVAPYGDGGIRLTLDPLRSSKLALTQKIVFTTVPTSEGLTTTGHLEGRLLGPMGALTIQIREKAAQRGEKAA
jgi:hypothetical protein